MPSEPKRAEPLSIWFFVGVILCVFGALVVLSDFLPCERATVLAEIHPALWWGAITAACGAVLLGIGIRQLRADRRPGGRPEA